MELQPLGKPVDRRRILNRLPGQAEPAALDAILAEGSRKAAALAAPTLEGAYKALGLPR